MPVPLFIVDAFTPRPFGGNPAAVCVLERMPEDARLQAIAAEMNLSETAFLLREGSGCRLRWFTPTVEVDLCGHATLAAAHVLWETGLLAPEALARFFTRSGELAAAKVRDWIELDFPSEPAAAAPAPQGLENVLGARIVWAGRNRMDVLVELESEAAVRGLRPSFAALAAVETPRGIVATARASGGGADFVSRAFFPRAGILEDPVTGSAHCALGPYWAAKLGKAELTGYQASARGGWVKVAVAGARVKLSGQAVTLVRGELLA